MEHDNLTQEIEALIAALGEEVTIARPAAEREVTAKIRLFLEATRDQRTGAARDGWESYLPYAARRCYQLSRLEEGWEEDLEYFASEHAQFWLDLSSADLEHGDLPGCRRALAQISAAVRCIQRDRIAQVEILLQALETAVEISDKKRAVQLYEEAEKLHRKHLAGGGDNTGSAWLPKIKKMGQRLKHYQEKLRRYYQYAETVTVALEADSERDLERVINYFQENLPGRVTLTRRAKAVEAAEPTGRGRYRARLKITLES
jgi:hypothetical protein